MKLLNYRFEHLACTVKTASDFQVNEKHVRNHSTCMISGKFRVCMCALTAIVYMYT